MTLTLYTEPKKIDNYFCFNTPKDQFEKYYPNFKLPFASGKQITTQLPKMAAVIRVIATLVFTAYAVIALSSPVWRWTAVVAGLAFSGWTIYANLLRKDPLVETFYKMVGGKENFEKLPVLESPDLALTESTKRPEWKDFDMPIYRIKTSDGRRGIIVKVLSRNIEWTSHMGGFVQVNAQIQGIFAFIEKINFDDWRPSNERSLFKHICSCLQQALGLGSSLHEVSKSVFKIGREKPLAIETIIGPSLSSDLANEIAAQLSAISFG